MILHLFTKSVDIMRLIFSLENLASSNKLEMIDRSQVVEALVARGKDVIGNQNGRDVGIQVSGTILKIKDLPLAEYRFGVFNGSGINVADTANEAKDIAGRLIFTPLKGFSFGGEFYNIHLLLIILLHIMWLALIIISTAGPVYRPFIQSGRKRVQQWTIIIFLYNIRLVSNNLIYLS